MRWNSSTLYAVCSLSPPGAGYGYALLRCYFSSSNVRSPQVKGGECVGAGAFPLLWWFGWVRDLGPPMAGLEMPPLGICPRWRLSGNREPEEPG